MKSPAPIINVQARIFIVTDGAALLKRVRCLPSLKNTMFGNITTNHADKIIPN